MMASPLLLLSLAIAQGGAPPPPSRAEIAIVNVRVEVGDGTVLPRTTVLIREGRISEIKESATWPAGVLTIDGAGKTLYPGFIDAFTSRGVKLPPEFSGDGRPNAVVTAPASMWVGNRKGISPEWSAAANLDWEKDDNAYEAGLTNAVICPTRGSLRGTAAFLDLLPSSLNARVLNPSAGVGLSFRNGSGSGYPSNVLGVIALMRQTLSDAVSVRDGAVLAEGEKPPVWMASLAALQPLVKGQAKGWFEVNLDREILRALTLADEFGFPTVIVGGREAHAHAELLKERKVPVVYSPDIGDAPNLDPPKADTPPADITPMEYRQERYDLWKARAVGSVKLHQAGILQAFTSEGMTLSEFLPAIRSVIQQGLPREAALRALTLGPAELLGVASDLGTVAVGKRANLVLMSGEFDKKDSKVERVWVDGRPMYTKKEAAK